MAVSKSLRHQVMRRDNHTPPTPPWAYRPWQPNPSRYRADRPIRIEPVRRVAEEWRPVVGYEGLYEVSDRGGVRSVLRTVVDTRGVARTFQGVQLQPTFEGNPGYCVVSLYRNRVHKYRRVHTLVAEAFLGPRPAGAEVAHRDGDPAHTCLRNLRYATPSENQMDRVQHGTSNRGPRNAQAVLTEANVLRIDAALRSGLIQRVVAADFGVSRTTVSAIATGRSWAHLTGRQAAQSGQVTP